MADPALIEAVVRPVYETVLGPGALQNFSVEIADDQTGEESIYVRAKLAARLYPVDQKSYELLHRQTHDAIRAVGEKRYSYLIFDFEDPVEVIDDALPRRRSGRK